MYLPIHVVSTSSHAMFNTPMRLHTYLTWAVSFAVAVSISYFWQRISYYTEATERNPVD